MDEARQRLQRAGMESGPSVPARSLAQAVQQRWAGAAAPLAKALSDWLLDMERLRYAAPLSSAALELKPLRERWRALKRQHWPQNNKPQP